MSTYDFLQRFAAGWGLAYFGVIFIVAVVYALLPSKRKTFEDAARIPLRED